jgi:dCTP diphosphatase
MNLNRAQKICAGFLGFLLIFWVVLFATGTHQGFYNYLYSFLFGLIPLFGGIYTIARSDVWGGVKSTVGRAVFFIGMGLFLWGVGSLIWAYYNFFLNTPAPYPSLSDIYFVPSIFLYGMGIIFLSQALGAKYALRSNLARILAIGIPIIAAFFSYYILITIANQGALFSENETLLKSILDIGYPLGDFLSLSLAILVSGLSFKYFGGNYKISILALLLGLAFMFISDFTFSYTTTLGTFYNGDFGDLFFTFGAFLLTFGVLGFTKVQVLRKSAFFFYPRGPGTYEQIAVRIIKEQEAILGPVAWAEAIRIPGLTVINKERGSVVIETPDKQMVINMLASAYENFFGKAAREVSTEAIEQPKMREIQTKLFQFSEERGWLENAMPASYAKSISIEAAELLELFQWDHPTFDNVLENEEKLLNIQRELADVLIYGINLANLLDLDVMAIIQEKIEYNEKKYPAKALKDDPDLYLQIKHAYRRAAKEA